MLFHFGPQARTRFKAILMMPFRVCLSRITPD
jgi:hypothetical protein